MIFIVLHASLLHKQLLVRRGNVGIVVALWHDAAVIYMTMYLYLSYMSST